MYYYFPLITIVRIILLFIPFNTYHTSFPKPGLKNPPEVGGRTLTKIGNRKNNGHSNFSSHTKDSGRRRKQKKNENNLWGIQE